MAFWRIPVACSSCFLAAIALAQSPDPGSVVVTKALTRTEVDAAVSGVYRLQCPLGFQPAAIHQQFHYPPEDDFDTRYGIDDAIDGGLSNHVDLASGGGEFVFRQPTAGHWTDVVLILECLRDEDLARLPMQVSGSFVALPDMSDVEGFARCPTGQSVLGGSAQFPGGEGVVLVETPDVDPFDADPESEPSELWHAVGSCLKPGCQMFVSVLCGTLPRHD